MLAGPPIGFALLNSAQRCRKTIRRSRFLRERRRFKYALRSSGAARVCAFFPTHAYWRVYAIRLTVTDVDASRLTANITAGFGSIAADAPIPRKMLYTKPAPSHRPRRFGGLNEHGLWYQASQAATHCANTNHRGFHSLDRRRNQLYRSRFPRYSQHNDPRGYRHLRDADGRLVIDILAVVRHLTTPYGDTSGPIRRTSGAWRGDVSLVLDAGGNRPCERLRLICGRTRRFGCR